MILTQTAICTALPSLIGIIEVNLFTMFVQFGVFLLEFSDKMELALWFFFVFFSFFFQGYLAPPPPPPPPLLLLLLILQ